MRARLQRDLIKSDYVRAPLPIYKEDTREARCEGKVALESKLLDDLSNLDKWTTTTIRLNRVAVRTEDFGENLAHIELSDKNIKGEGSKHSVKFTSPCRLPGVPEEHGWPGGIMCIPSAYFHVDHENWEDYNRLSCWIYTDMPGFRNPCLRMQFHNDGEHPVPDRWDREGHHNINLQNGEWFHVQLEIPYIHRDNVIGISFDYDMVGRETVACKEACWYISDLRLEKVAEEDLDHYHGWDIAKDRIAFSGSGYQTGSMKTAVICGTDAKYFRLVETETGRTVLKKEIETVTTSTGEFQIMDFSEIVEPGEYFIACGEITTRTFPIGDAIWEDSVWKTVNFLLCERCGWRVPGKHDVCCVDRFVKHPKTGLVVQSNGGWHDAGDMSQCLTNTAEITASMFEMANRVEGNTELHKRLLEEGRWGLDWMLKTRFGDGYRATGTGGAYWTDGKIGDGDDFYREAGMNPFDNFLSAGAEALAAVIYRDIDATFAEYTLKAAKEDWGFADKAHKAGYGIGHDHAVSLVSIYSAACWSAVDLFKATGDPFYHDMAKEYAAKVLACQQQKKTGWDIPLNGFFYRDENSKIVSRGNHRSQENGMMMALAHVCEAFPDDPDWINWYYGIVLYSENQKKVFEYTAPYYMAPCSIYHEDEIDWDLDTFIAQHMQLRGIGADEVVRKQYADMLHNGVKLGDGYYLRRFPVWYSFRGNHTPVLSGGKAAAQAAMVRNDYKLAELGQRQLEWIVGKNPFAESVMYGEGYDYCQEYAVCPGEMVGELGVGIESMDQEDSPFWPQVNTCTYKEVFVLPASRWAWLCADVYGPAKILGVLHGCGDITFTHKGSGKVYTATPCADCGMFQLELPSGEYTVCYDGVTKEMDFIAGKSYKLTSIASYDVSSKLDGDKLTITVKTAGKGKATFALRGKNVKLDKAEASFELGDTLTFTGKVEDAAYPYLAVLIPDGKMNEKLEVYGE